MEDIAVLEALFDHSAITPKIATKIGKEIRAISAGVKGEKDAAYQIDFDFNETSNWAVIHDLRIEHQGRVAQIDHILINRFLHMWVCESKYFAQGIAINEFGEFTSFYGKNPVAIPSPLEQNRRHCSVLNLIFEDNVIKLPRRMGLSIRPKLNSLILVSNKARITRPKTKVEGVDRILKVEQIFPHINDAIDKTSVVNLSRTISSNSLQDFADQLVKLHTPATINWLAKFGLPSSELPKTSSDGKVKKSKLICATCNVSVPFNTAKLCWFNKKKFGENIYCWACQQTFNDAT